MAIWGSELETNVAHLEGNPSGPEVHIRPRESTPGASDSFFAVGAFESGGTGGSVSLVAKSADAWLHRDEGALLGHTLFATRGAPAVPRLADGLVSRSGIARFEPLDPPVATPLQIEFALPESLRGAIETLAIYSISPDGGVNALDTTLEPESGTRAYSPMAGSALVARTRTLGSFALIEDQSPPRIVSVRPANGKTITARRPRLTVHFTELGKGLDDEATRFTLDGQRLIPEYDPDAALIKATPKEPLALGVHTFEVTIRDNAGHETSATSRFTVSAGATSTKKSKRSAK